MSQELQTAHLRGDWEINKLSTLLIGDLTAATISATAVSPVITAIDRSANPTFSENAKILTNLAELLSKALLPAVDPYYQI